MIVLRQPPTDPVAMIPYLKDPYYRKVFMNKWLATVYTPFPGRVVQDVPTSLSLCDQIIDKLIGLSSVSQSVGTVSTAFANYNTSSIIGIPIAGQPGYWPATVNHKVFFWSIQNSNSTFKVRKSEYVPARHYFVRVKNRDFNYSNNPTYVYDGKTVSSTGITPSAGTIYNQDFISNPTTYITTVGLYNDNNELVAVAKLSRPAVKTFDNELLVKVRLDF